MVLQQQHSPTVSSWRCPMSRIDQIKAQMFQANVYVCGGHGAWKRAGGGKASSGTFDVPKGVTIHFYVKHGEGLANSIGQRVDQILAGGVAPNPRETLTGGQWCYNYHLFW